MTLTLYPPLCFNEPGQRDNNEDSVSPAPGTAGIENRVFVVCDGVGGGASGEIASRIVADGMTDYFNAHAEPSGEETIAAALQSAEQLLQTYLQTHPGAAGMATTLTLLHLHEQGATVAHVGDSRVYCCREGRIVFETDDHKLVNEWVQNGILTPEQAAEHPQRNVITRAVRGTDKSVRADVALLKGLRADDYFFLCTDGVLEHLTTRQLADILATAEPDEAKMAAIRACCDGQTSDNYSAYLVHVHTADTTGEPPVETSPAASMPTASLPTPKPVGAVPAPVRPMPVATAVASPKPIVMSPPARLVTSQPSSAAGQVLSMEPPFRYLMLGVGLVAGLLMVWFMLFHSPTTSHGITKPHQSFPHRPAHHPALPRLRASLLPIVIHSRNCPQTLT